MTQKPPKKEVIKTIIHIADASSLKHSTNLFPKQAFLAKMYKKTNTPTSKKTNKALKTNEFSFFYSCIIFTTKLIQRLFLTNLKDNSTFLRLVPSPSPCQALAELLAYGVEDQ